MRVVRGSRTGRATLPLIALVLVGGAALADDAHAGDPPEPPAAAGAPDATGLPLRARPSWRSIPRAAIPGLPSHEAAPASLAATEQVTGFTAENNGTGGSPRVRAFVETTQARRSCLAGEVDFGTEDDPTLRDSSMVAHLRLGVVSALRAERLVVDGGGGAALEITDLWVDPRSRGMRLIQTTRMPLAVLARAAKTTVYGYRDASDQLWAVLGTETQGSAVDSGGERFFSGCGHVRLAADASGAQVALLWQGRSLFPNAAHGGPSRLLVVTVASSRSSRDREPVVSVVMALTPERAPVEVVD